MFNVMTFVISSFYLVVSSISRSRSVSLDRGQFRNPWTENRDWSSFPK